MRSHAPIIKTVAGAAASFAVLWLVAAIRGESGLSRTAGLVWFGAGLLYTHFFEYAYHRWPMHHRMRWTRWALEAHMDHHRAFHGATFRRAWDEPQVLTELVQKWWTFPVLFWGHVPLFWAILPAGALVPFMLGAASSYTAFETFHWFTHIRDNGFDAVLIRIPVIGAVRRAQIEFHRIHHERPVVNFNFNPPYLGDRLGGTYRP